MLEARSISLSAGTKDLLVNASFRIGNKDRVGLVGLNGTGKSTLLRCIKETGNSDPALSGGEIIRSSDTTIGFLPQEISFENDLEQTALHYVLQANAKLNELSEFIEQAQLHLEAAEYDHESAEYHRLIERYSDAAHEFERLGGYRMEAEAEKVLSGLGFSQKDFQKKVGAFSGGWQMRLLIARLLLQKPTLLLLDEPTNHLDIDSLRWLENYMLGYEHSCIIVSHDRFFLDKITARTLEINFRTIYEYKGNYSYYEKEKAQRFELMMSKYENDLKKMADLKAFVDRFRYKATKAKQAQSRLRQMQKLEEELQAPEEDMSGISFSFPKARHSGKVVLKLEQVGKSWQQPDGSRKMVLQNLDLDVLRGDRIAIIGSNGAGKTTFCRIVSGDLDCDGGKIRYGHNVSLNYFAQHQTENLAPEKTVLQEMMDAAPDAASQRKVRDILGCFLFSGGSVEKKTAVLSGGEKSRLSLAKILLQSSNLLVMDEPTNHLDMRSKEMLIDALENYDGTLMLVSHDRYFLDSLINKVIEIKNGSLQVYLGSYGEYLEKAEKALAEERKKGAVSEKKKPGAKKTTAHGRRKQSAGGSHTAKAEKLEKKIHGLEEQKREYETTMGSPDFYSLPEEETRKTVDRYHELCKTIEQLYAEWESALS